MPPTVASVIGVGGVHGIDMVLAGAICAVGAGARFHVGCPLARQACQLHQRIHALLNLLLLRLVLAMWPRRPGSRRPHTLERRRSRLLATNLPAGVVQSSTPAAATAAHSTPCYLRLRLLVLMPPTAMRCTWAFRGGAGGARGGGSPQQRPLAG
ncbi:hypothetical protein DUNSADRAFT_4929 [Dunaliella salina]|uniref:Uncharacterized protein n=1 Tax=Dunaliella salina TaxID=3046 RepID=A0ABQ7GR14_DUNSA|nr:hypothetical protein DUNSADRAFT_4929 [Dunaliella salina]|eukprot:KAF5837049.1 hypothetical protein DUNSADRAFT_4929 [Dunaliella salina]